VESGHWLSNYIINIEAGVKTQTSIYKWKDELLSYWQLFLHFWQYFLGV